MNNAGDFSTWVDEFIGTMKGEASGDVPCGDCVGCCTSSKFILVRPTDGAARTVIPKELLFPCPGLPKGYDLLGYDEQGHCPMFKNGACSIYSKRPETCRQYDCRVLAATGASIEEESTVIQERIKAWQFSYASKSCREKSKSIQRAMGFLKEYGSEFPSDYLPSSDSQKAALAIRIHNEFLNDAGVFSREASAAMVEKIVNKYPTI